MNRSGTDPFPAMAELLPHAAPSILLDCVVDWQPESIVTRVTIGSATPWRLPQGVPAHVAIEYMAQACAAFVGLEARQQGSQPKIGLLLGTRDFSADRAWFRDGETLDVAAQVSFRDEQIGVFACRVLSGGEEICRAQLTVTQPQDLASVMTRPAGVQDG